MKCNPWVGGSIGRRGFPMLGTGKRGLSTDVKDIFRNGEEGFFYDPNDLTEEKIKWRKNLLLDTEDFSKWANGFTATPVTDGWLLETTATSGHNLSLQYPIGTGAAAGTIVRSIELKKGTADFVRFGSASDGGAISIDLRDLSIKRNGFNNPYTLQAIGDGWFRFEFFQYSTTFGASSLSNTLVWGMTFSGSGVDVVGRVGSTIYARKPSYAYIPSIDSNAPIPYQPITDFNSDFIRAFPSHTLYQDAAGTIPVTAVGQPVGLMLDKSKGLVLGSNQISYPNSEELPAAVNMGDGVGTWALNTNAPISGTQDSRLIVTVPALLTSRPSLTFSCSSPLVPSKLYKFSFRYKVNSGVPRVAAVHTGAGTTYITPDKRVLQGSGTFDVFILWTAGSQTLPIVYFSNESVFDLQIDDISAREVKGNHAYQTTSASRPTLQQSPIFGNELVVNGDFSNGTVGWGTAGSGTPNWGISLGAATAALSNSASRYLIYLAGGTVAGKSYYVSFDVSGSNGTGGVRFGNGTDNSSAWFTGNGKVGFILTARGATPNNLWFQANANWSGSVDNLSVKEITGYRTDRNYLSFDGIDDYLQTNNIDFTATDKVSLFAGVRKLADSVQIIAELSADVNSNTGSFYLVAGNDLDGIGYTTISKGSSNLTNDHAGRNFTHLAPDTAVLSVKHDISGDLSSIRRNGVVGIDGTDDKGAGNFGNHPLYIGRRAGTTLPFTGHIYSLIGVGRLTTDSETAAIEKEIAKRTGVTLNV